MDTIASDTSPLLNAHAFPASIQEQRRHQHVERLRLLRRLDDGGTLVKRKADELVGLAEEVGIADARCHVEGHAVILRHLDEIVDLLEELLRFLGLLLQGLGQHDGEQVLAFRAQGPADRGSVGSARTGRVDVVAAQDEGVGEQLDDLLMQVAAMTRPEYAILLRTLLLDGSELLEDIRDALLLFLDSKLRFADVGRFSLKFQTFRRIVLAQSVVPIVVASKEGGIAIHFAVCVITLDCMQRTARSSRKVPELRPSCLWSCKRPPAGM
mmetsp:Transcript_10698/g.29514  ORF Transcript_10698/g.29514 Transcript_10698/m.29514 type:complete len:268 (-) Transcript_10698:61-864(-)